MANYADSTTVVQERALTYHVAKYNANPDNPGAPNVTNAQYRQKVVNHQMDNLVDAMRAERRAALEQKYEDATPAQKATVNTTLGYTE